MFSTITHDRSISINESGITTIRYEVEHDQDRSVRLTFEEYLPDAIDPTTIAVDRDRGKWAVYEDGTVQWSVSVRAGETATGEFGVVCTNPDPIAALVESSANRIVAGEPAAPPDTGDDIETVEPADLASASANERVPESVYEAVREHRDAASTGSIAPATRSDRHNAPTDHGETASTDAGHERHVSSGRESEENPAVEDHWNGDPLENALRVKDHQSRADENAYRFVLDFDEADANDTAIEVLTGLLNGTTVFGANPTLPDLEAGANPETLTVTISSALEEEAIVSALEDIEHTTVEHFETLDVDLSGSTPLDTNADQQFRLLDETVQKTGYDSIADDVEAFDTGEFDFGNEPVSYEDLVSDPDEACETAEAAPVNADAAPVNADAAPVNTDAAPVNADGAGDDADSAPADCADGSVDTAGVSVDADDDSDEQTRSGGADGTAAGERVTARLLDELEAGGVTERERVELRRRLGVDPRTSTELRLDHLHSRVDELLAYTDALEAFLDEEGTAQEILSDLSESVSTLETRTQDLEERFEARTSDLEDRLESRTRTLEDRLDEETTNAAAERDSLEDRIESLASDHAAERERVSGIADAVSSNSDDIDHLATHVKSQFETLEETVTDVTQQLSALDERVTEIEDSLVEVEHVVEQNARVRKRLESLTN